MSNTALDVLTPLREGEPFPKEARDSLLRQMGVDVKWQPADQGAALPGEPKFQTLARARNRLKHLGTAELVLFLDNHIILPAGAVKAMVDTLQANPDQAAVGLACRSGHLKPNPPHVGLSCLLIRRSDLDEITFRATPTVCECRFMCMDLRRRGRRIDYLPGWTAEHRTA